MRKIIFYLKAILFLFITLIFSAIIIGSLPVDFKHGNIYNFVVKTWGRVIFFMFRIKIIFKNLEIISKNKTYIFIANHRSMIDIPPMLSFLPVRIKFILKRELIWIPFIGLVFYFHHFNVNRKKGKKTIDFIKQNKKFIKQKTSLFIFPEGTRSRTGELLPFKKGAFLFAKEFNLPLMPIYITESDNICHPDSIYVKPGTITIEVLPEIDIHLKDDIEVNELRDYSRNIFVEKQKEKLHSFNTKND